MIVNSGANFNPPFPFLDICQQALVMGKGLDGGLPNYTLWIGAINALHNSSYFHSDEGVALRREIMSRGLVREVTLRMFE